MKSVYIESTIINWLNAKPSRDLIEVAHCYLAWEWWEKRRHEFRLYVSDLVRTNIQSDETVAQGLKIMDGIEALPTTDKAASLAEQLLSKAILPATAADQALHLAIAATHEIDFLLTWDCKHLANAGRAAGMRQFLKEGGYTRPVVCTPNGLLGEICSDPVVEEMEQVKERLAKKYNYDVHAMFEALREEQKKHPERVVSLAKDRADE